MTVLIPPTVVTCSEKRRGEQTDFASEDESSFYVLSTNPHRSPSDALESIASPGRPSTLIRT